MDTLFNDLRYTLRTLAKAPAFTLAAVAALPLGIGANTAIFSVVNAVLLKPVPGADPDRIVYFMNATPRGNGPGASPAKFVHYGHQTDVAQDVTAFRTTIVNWTTGGTPEQLRAGQVSEPFFRLFGAGMLYGRPFSVEEDRPKAAKVAVLSHGLWTRRFGANSSVLGRSMSLGGELFTIIGVTAQGFDVEGFGANPDIWIPFQLDPNSTDQGHYFSVVGRLKAGVTLKQ